jgi:hypothetical protein
VEVCYYFPFKLEDGTYTTPFELAHHLKSDFWLLLKPFCLAAVHRERIGDGTLPKIRLSEYSYDYSRPMS